VARRSGRDAARSNVVDGISDVRAPDTPSRELISRSRSSSERGSATRTSKIVRQGGKLIYGGRVLWERGGYFVERTIVLSRADMPIVAEEIFAPILHVYRGGCVRRGDQVLTPRRHTCAVSRHAPSTVAVARCWLRVGRSITNVIAPEVPIRALLVGVRDAQQQCFIKRPTHELQADWQTIFTAEAAWH
jgi:Aldehyde dehydrogenase family